MVNLTVIRLEPATKRQVLDQYTSVDSAGLDEARRSTQR